jgi:thioesterase domain-containing protein
MTPAELQDYLHTRIPLSRAMAVEVRAAGPAGVTLQAPIEPNINHRDTIFGGSASALAILAAWSALYVRLHADGLAGRIVIRRNTMSYDRPMSTEFTATAEAPGEAACASIAATLARGRPARVSMRARLECEGEVAGALEADFAVLPPVKASAPRSPS